MSNKATKKDLELFFGENAQTYIDYWEFAYNKKKPKSKFRLTFHWPSFFIGPIWMFYRKLYLPAVVLIIAYAGLDYIIDVLLSKPISTTGVAHILFAVTAKPIAVWNATARIKKINNLNLSKSEREKQIRSAGGISMVAALMLLAVFMIMAGFVIVDELGYLED